MNTQELISQWGSLSAEQLVAKANEHLPFWVSLMLVIVIAYYLARLVWLIYPSSDEALWTPPQSAPTRQSATPAGVGEGYGAIANAHLFGAASEEPAPVIEDTENAPDTRLNLKLRATVAATDAALAHAIIADGSGEEKVYFVSDAVPGGATLAKVEVTRVILNRGGVLEALRLPREFEGTPTGAATRNPVRTRSAATASNVQQMISANAGSFMEVIRPQPFMPNGQLKGYRVFPGRNRQQFVALGLRPGDLVTQVNGVALNNPAQGMEIFNSLGASSQITVTVERNGRPQELTMDLSQITPGGGKR